MYSCFFYQSSGLAIENSALAIINGKYLILKNDIQEKINFINMISKTNINYNNKADRDKIIYEYILTYLINLEAKSRNYDIQDSDIPEIIKNLEHANNIKDGDIEKNLKQYNLDKKTLYKLIKQEYIANTFKHGIIISTVKISQAEIENEINNILLKNGKLALDLYEISIPTSESNAKEKIDNAYEELKKGYSFDDVAKKYSSNLGPNGSKMGWVLQEVLGYSVLNAINTAGLYNPTNVLTVGDAYKIYMAKEVKPALQININNPQQMEQLKQFVNQKLMFEKSYAAEEQYTQNLIKASSIEFYDN